MNSPSKRRKKNDGSSKPVRKLDFFFAKQTAKAAAAAANDASTTSTPDAALPVDPSNMTDEEYARKLQEEWDQEARGVPQAQEQPPKEDEMLNSSELYRDP